MPKATSTLAAVLTLGRNRRGDGAVISAAEPLSRQGAKRRARHVTRIARTRAWWHVAGDGVAGTGSSGLFIPSFLPMESGVEVTGGSDRNFARAITIAPGQVHGGPAGGCVTSTCV